VYVRFRKVKWWGVELVVVLCLLVFFCVKLSVRLGPTTLIIYINIFIISLVCCPTS